MGETYVKIWAKCRDEELGTLREMIAKDKSLLGIVISFFVAVAFYFLTLALQWSQHEAPAAFTAAVCVASLIAVVVLLRKASENDPIKRLQTKGENSRKVTRAFLREANLAEEDLPRVLETVTRCRDDKKAGKTTFMNRVFSLFMTGILVACVGCFLGFLDALEAIVCLALSLLAFAVCAGLTLISKIAWEIWDLAGGSSLLKAESMIASLECFIDDRGHRQAKRSQGRSRAEKRRQLRARKGKPQ